jgi:L-ribulose-5-phosphate 3-epimerase
MIPLGIYEKALPSALNWHERLAMAKAAGFDFVEISIDESSERLDRLNWSAERKQELRNAVSDTGVSVLSMCLSGHRKYPLGSASQLTRQRALEILRKAIDFAADIGIRIVQIAGYYVFYEPHVAGSQQRYHEGLVRGTEWAAEGAVMLALENVDGDDVSSVRTAMSFVQKINSPWLQVYPDIGNLSEHGLDVCAELEHAWGHIVGVHVKDTRPGEPRRVPFGEGVVPFAKAFKKLAEMQFAGPIMLEMWNDDSSDSLRIIQTSRDWVIGRMLEGSLISAPAQ